MKKGDSYTRSGWENVTNKKLWFCDRILKKERAFNLMSVGTEAIMKCDLK